MNGFYCAGNWKMNKNPAQAAEFLTKLKSEAPVDSHGSLVILPPAILATTVAESLKGSTISWGGQNCYFESTGAFTGETSPAVLHELGAKFCLVGHSERRQIFGEPEEMLSRKVKGCQDHGLTPILCVGETIDDRRWNRTEEVIVRQLKTGLQLADSGKNLWLAYEPVWAIGTGQVATPEQVEEAHSVLRRALRDWNARFADSIPILYGGSVKPENVSSLATLKNVDGFLIGGASLEVADFLKIYQGSREARG